MTGRYADMSTKPRKIKRVLLVDDNADYLDMIEEVFEVWAGGSWHILTATSAGQALALIEERPMDLAVIDLRMPGVDGLQFLQLLHKRVPAMPKVMLTGQADEENKTQCINSGAALFLEKPVGLDAMKGIYEALDKLISTAPENPFGQSPQSARLLAAIQSECTTHSSSVIEINGISEQGKIFIKHGSLVHAETLAIKGQPALNALISLSDGSFALRPFSEPQENTFDAPWQFLVDEAVRAASQPLDKKNALKAPTGGSISASSQDDNGPANASSSGLSDANPIIEEILVCGANDVVLFQWNCNDPQARIALMNSLQKQAASQTNRALGDSTRIELLDKKSVTWVEFKPAGKVFFKQRLSTAKTGH